MPAGTPMRRSCAAGCGSSSTCPPCCTRRPSWWTGPGARSGRTTSTSAASNTTGNWCSPSPTTTLPSPWRSASPATWPCAARSAPPPVVAAVERAHLLLLPAVAIAGRRGASYAPSVDDLAPGLLIAVPQMGDPNFSRSVVLLIEHSDAGAMGIVFNRPSEVPLSEIGMEQGLRVHPEAGRAFIGGPVSPERGFLLHRRADMPDSIKVHDGVFLSVSTESLKPLLAGDPAAYRLCLGYAGWGPGQLEREVVGGGWLNSSISSKRIFDTPVDKIWDAAIRDLGIDPAFLVHGGGKQ